MQRFVSTTAYQVVLASSIFLAVIWTVPAAVHAEPETGEHLVFLPVVAGKTAAPPTCALNQQEQQIQNLLLSHPNQGRIKLVCDPVLSAVARARAEDMGRRGYFSHVNPDGQGPNYLVRQAGYTLPTDYSTAINGNNIESIGAGPGDAAGMWNGWMESTKHVTHILGKTEFFAQQIDYGIGFAQVPGSPYQFYWVFISSKPV
ncbi:MAG: CAP domain-containing protein [Caldilineaceae bacterium]